MSTANDNTHGHPLHTRRAFVRLAVATAAASCAAGSAFAATAPAVRTRRPLIIDTLGGLGNPNHEAPAGSGDVQDAFWQLDERAFSDGRLSGLSAVNQTIGYIAGPQDPFRYTVADLARWSAFIEDNAQHLLPVATASDIRRAHASHRCGVILGFQNSLMFADQADRVAQFAAHGVRVMQLTYNVRNLVGDGSMVAENLGLTPFGHDVVQAMNDSHVIVDLSHSGERTCLDAIAASRQPIAITHTGCRAITDLPRNKTDRELRGVAERGGVVGIYFMPFLAIDRQPTAEDLLAHIEHAINVCGEEHVTIGTDGVLSAVDDMDHYLAGLKAEVDGRRAAGISATGERADIVPFLPDLQGPDKFWRLAELLEQRGHSATRVDRILGANFYRYAASIWRADPKSRP